MAEAQKTLRVTQIEKLHRLQEGSACHAQEPWSWQDRSFHDLVDNESVRGMIFKVKHLVKVEEL